MGLHQLELGAGDDVRRLGAVDEHRADDQVDLGSIRSIDERGREDRRAAVVEQEVQLAQAVDRAVIDVGLGAHPDRDLRRRQADHAAADDHHLARRDAGHAAEQQPAAAERLLQHERAGLRGDLARDLAHRRQQRQPPVARRSTVS